MRDYELIFIVHPDLEENAFNDIIQRVQTWINDGGGQVEKVDIWGKRKLAYPIRKQNEGQYVLIDTRLAPEFCSTLERNMRFLEPVMRYSLVAKE